MTRPMSLECAHCGRTFTWTGGPGPRPSYCRTQCRHAAHHARQQARGYERPQVTVPPELHARLRNWCETEDRVMAKVVARAVTEYLDAQGAP